MTHDIYKIPNCFSKSSKKPSIPIQVFEKGDFNAWIKKQNKHIQQQVAQAGFEAKAQSALTILDKDGALSCVLFGLNFPAENLDTASLYKAIQTCCAGKFLSQNVFHIESLHEEDVANKIAIGWGLGAYKFTSYKKSTDVIPTLIWPENIDQKHVNAVLEATYLLRNAVNTPTNDMGTEAIADIVKDIAKDFKADVKIIKGDKLLSKNFPLIHAVGRACTVNEPQLVDLRWGKKSYPKVTLVGKGLVYDTGGLNIKPGSSMNAMKKDMSGAAHVLSIAYMVMALKLPIQLRVLLPLAENSIAGNSFRPGDILPTRKGITIEIENTDAEGRLVLADALAYACEDTPDLLIDFATLTGGIAAGHDLPGLYSNNDKTRKDLHAISDEHQDSVWPMPLYAGYEANINGTISDIKSVGSGRAGHIEAALILQRFITPETNWVHFDIFGWQQVGKAGRPAGAAEMGIHAVFHFIKKRYG